ncbi:MAG: hypothetical protein LBT65_00185, partial [Synergistaceae bacterium]|nr:hypothetical protein [Synergistaceae bacterium]
LAGIFEQDELRDEPTKPVAGDTKDRKGESATEAADPSDSPSSDLPFSDLPFSAAALKRLDPKYAPVLYALLEREGRNAEPWSREEWSALARRHGFMPNALIEELNTWGEEALGDFLLFDDDDGPVLNRDVWN